MLYLKQNHSSVSGFGLTQHQRGGRSHTDLCFDYRKCLGFPRPPQGWALQQRSVLSWPRRPQTEGGGDAVDCFSRGRGGVCVLLPFHFTFTSVLGKISLHANTSRVAGTDLDRLTPLERTRRGGPRRNPFDEGSSLRHRTTEVITGLQKAHILKTQRFWNTGT